MTDAHINSKVTALPSEDSVDAARLARVLKQRIKLGAIAPGQRLVEADLMRETGASRGRVREAIKALATEGLIVIEEYRGAFVKKFTPEEVFQIGQARENLESFAARLIAERKLEPKLREELKEIQKGLNEAAAAMRFEEYTQFNEKLHTFIYENCGNKFVADFLERLRVPVFRLQHQAMYRDPMILKGNAEHESIVNAILAGDGDLAEALMRSHVRKGASALHEFYYNQSKDLSV